jgi:RND family efflux transporter MFP subunit
MVEKIAIRPGEVAAEGAILVQLEKREQEIAVARARADFNIARTNAARFAGLVDDEAASALEYESAQNELSATTAALKQAEYNLERRAIRAPFAGVVGLTSLDIGDYVTAGAKVTTIDDISALVVDFRIPENASAFVSEGLEVNAVAQASGGRSVTGRIRAVDSRVDPATRTRHVEALLPNEDGALIPGSTFSISLDLSGRTAVKAPGLAVQWDRAGAYVWKVGADNTAERVPVVILKREAEYVLLDAALTPADRIVAEGAEMVRPGAPLVDRRQGDAGARARTDPSAVFQ